MKDESFIEDALAHVDMLYNLARSMVRGREEAEDLVQETYSRALEASRQKIPDRMAPWLATICLNTARSWHRRRRARPAEVLEADPGLASVGPHDTAGEALSNIQRSEVRDAIAALPPEQREAVTLMDLCGFTASQVAEITGAPRNTVLSRVHRGHKRLAVLLGEVKRHGP